MSWKSLSFDWNQARAFLAVAEKSSLSGAAEALGVTQPTISRQISALETDLKVALFERTGRSVALTPTGLELVEFVRTMAEAANLMSLAASGKSQEIKGQVKVTATDITSAYVLPPAISRLKHIAPNLEIRFVADNDVQDLLRREADIAIRHVRPEQPNLISKLVCEDAARFYAVQDYIDTNGEPTLDCDFTQHQFVSFGDKDRMLGYLLPLGLKLTEKNFRYASNSQVAECQIARNGHEIAILTDRIAAKFPEFKPVLAEVAPFTIPTWLVAHRDLQTSRRIRLVFDLLADFLTE